MTKLEGVITALVTPFTEDCLIDMEGLRENVRQQIAAGVDGVLALGTTGEGPALTKEEQEQVLHAVIDEAKGKVHVMVGTGSNNTQNTLDRSRLAEQAGADSILVVTPYYNCPSQEGLYQHFAAVADATGIPVYLYNIPRRAGRNIEPETVARLAEIPNVAGIKEASGNITQIDTIISAAIVNRADFAVFSGDDAMTLPVLALGGCGVISVVSNLFPREMVGLVQAWKQGDILKAQEIHRQLSPIFKAAFVESNPAPIKAAMRMCGLPSGVCRLPLAPLGVESVEAVQHALAVMGRLQTVNG